MILSAAIILFVAATILAVGWWRAECRIKIVESYEIQLRLAFDQTASELHRLRLDSRLERDNADRLAACVDSYVAAMDEMSKKNGRPASRSHS